MSRILTGIQSTGRPHLGNLLGAILPAIELSKNPANDSLYFIADLHSLTTVRDAAVLRANTYAVSAAWLACGFDTEKNLFYRQSDVPQVTELTWYLSCFTPYPMLANAHSFKDKSDRLSDVNAGLEPGVVSNKVAELPAGQGLNAATGEYVDMFAAGIIDPAKVTRSALQNAASIAGLFLTTEVVVADKPEKAAAPAGDPTGGMDF